MLTIQLSFEEKFLCETINVLYNKPLYRVGKSYVLCRQIFVLQKCSFFQNLCIFTESSFELGLRLMCEVHAVPLDVAAEHSVHYLRRFLPSSSFSWSLGRVGNWGTPLPPQNCLKCLTIYCPPPPRHVCWKMSTGVYGGPSRGSSLPRPRSADPIGFSRNFQLHFPQVTEKVTSRCTAWLTTN